MIFNMVIDVTLVNLTEMECILLLLLLKSNIILCLCVLESLTLTNQNYILSRWKLQRIALLQM